MKSTIKNAADLPTGTPLASGEVIEGHNGFLFTVPFDCKFLSRNDMGKDGSIGVGFNSNGTFSIRINWPVNNPVFGLIA